MSIIVKEDQRKNILAPQGNHLGICISIIDLGTSFDQYYQKDLHKIRITWELCNEKAVFKEDEEPKPFVVSKDFTCSLSEKSNLRQHLESWRGKAFSKPELEGFDLINILGKPCLVNVLHRTAKTSGNEYVVVSGVSPLPKGMSVPESINKKFMLAFDEFDWDIFSSLPEFLKDKIKLSDEYKELAEKHDVDDDIGPLDYDEIPF